MNTDVGKIISILQNALHPVVIVKSILPEEFGLFVSSLVLMQKDNGKKITVIVEGNPEGWLKYIFGNFGVELSDSIQPMKHLIEIPCGDGSTSSVSYDVQDGKFLLYITPGNAKFDFNSVQFKTFGSQHDVLITVGLQNRADLDKILGEGKSSFISANQVVFGVSNIDSFIAENKNVFNGGTDLVAIMKIMLGLTKPGKFSEHTKNAIAALLLGAEPHKIKEPLFLAEVYRVLSELFKSGVNIGTINAVRANKKIEYAAIYKKIAEKAQVNTQKKTAIVNLAKNDIESAGIKVEDLTLNVKEIAEMLTVSSVTVTVEHDKDKSLVFVAGSSDEVASTANQLKLSLIDHNAAGFTEAKGESSHEIKQDKVQTGQVVLQKAEKQPTQKPAQQAFRPPQFVQKPRFSQGNETQKAIEPEVIQPNPEVQTEVNEEPAEEQIIVQTVTTQEEVSEETQNVGQSEQIDPNIQVLAEEQEANNPPTVQQQTYVPLRNVSTQALNFGEIAKRVRGST